MPGGRCKSHHAKDPEHDEHHFMKALFPDRTPLGILNYLNRIHEHVNRCRSEVQILCTLHGSLGLYLRMEGACIIRSGIEGLVRTSVVQSLGLKVKQALIQPDLIVTLNGKSFAFLLEGCFRNIDAEALFRQSVTASLDLEWNCNKYHISTWSCILHANTDRFPADSRVVLRKCQPDSSPAQCSFQCQLPWTLDL